MLSFYAGQFKTVEINHSFYRMPTENLLLQWAKSVPEGFKFALKANQQITHIKRLRGCEDTLKRFLEVASVLNDGDHLGPVLVQLPPNFKFDQCVTNRGTPRKLTLSFAGTERPFVWPRRKRKRLWKSSQPILLMYACDVKTTPQSNWQLGASALKNGFARE